MLLWNTASKEIETRYDGQFYVFAPGQKRDIYDQDCANHLLHKLTEYGLVSIREGMNSKEIKELEVKGKKNRWKMLHRIVSSYATMNQERQSRKMGPVPPDDNVFEAAKEAKQLMSEIAEEDKEKIEAVNEYLSQKPKMEIEKTLEELEPSLEISGIALETKEPGKKKK